MAYVESGTFVNSGDHQLDQGIVRSKPVFRRSIGVLTLASAFCRMKLYPAEKKPLVAAPSSHHHHSRLRRRKE